MPSEELKNLSIQNTPKTDPVKTAEQQLADIKSQAAKIVGQAQKLDPNIKISVADAEMIGAPKLAIPTQKRDTPTAPELTRTGTTTIPQTGVDKAREALLSQVPEEDRETISAILDASMGLQTERGSQLETQLDTLSQDRLDLAQRRKDRTLEGNRLLEEQGIPELSAELESIRSEADVLDARKNAAVQAEASRRGVSNIAQSNNIQAIEKDYNLQKANLAIRELASVGKINAATKLIDTKLDIKYGDIEAETELVKAQIEAILPMLSREDAKVAQTRLLLNEQVSATIAEARASDKALEEFKLQSYINAQQNGASPAVLSAIMSSDNREDVASVGGSFIQSPMEKLQMESVRANTAASWALANERINGGDTFITSEGAQITVPTFDEFINEKQNELGMSLTPQAREEYRKEYEDEKGIMEQATRVASLSPMAREVVNNPQAYYDLTPSVRGEIFEELAKKGIDTNAVITGKKKSLPATQAESLAQATGVKSDVVKLYNMLKELPGTGPIAGRLQALDPYNAKRIAIEAQITRIVPGLARGIFNEVGVLTDQDVARYTNTLANPNMTDAQIEALHRDTLSKIDQSISSTVNTFSSLGYDLGRFQSDVLEAPDNLTEDEAYAEYLKITKP